MKIETKREGSCLTLLLDGRIDSATAGQFEKAITDAADMKTLIIDMDKLVYMSSAGLRVLLLAQKKTSSMDSELKIVNVNPEVYSVLELTGFVDILNVEAKA